MNSFTLLQNIEGVFIKNEAVNSSGSIKDRFAKYAFKKALASGELVPGQVILEATSGNTGIAFARLAREHGNHLIAIMPEFASRERVKIMQSYGAEVRLTPAGDGVAGTIREYKRIASENSDYWLPRQFENIQNVEAHKNFTGAELVEQLQRRGIGKVNAFVAGVGTGGTLLGVSSALKKAFGNVHIVAVEPAESAVMSGGSEGFHKIEGIGEGFVPPLMKANFDVIDEVVAIGSDDAIKEAKRLASEFDLQIGISSGANMLAAKQVRNRIGGAVVTIAPDGSDRYGSIF